MYHIHVRSSSPKFKDYYVEVHGSLDHAPIRKAPHHGKKVRRLLADSDDDENQPTGSAGASTQSASIPAWERSWNQYINVDDEIPEGMSLVSWWGVRLIIPSLADRSTILIFVRGGLAQRYPFGSCMGRYCTRPPCDHGFLGVE